MTNRKFETWCETATAKIRYWGDRAAVAEELRGHLEDRYDALIASGCSREEATAKAIEAMGSAREIAPQLGKIHSPWLGWILVTLRIIGIMAISGALILSTITGRWGLGIPVGGGPQTVYLGNLIHYAWETHYYENPTGEIQWEGYHLEVTEAAIVPDGFTLSGPELHLLVGVNTPFWQTNFAVEDQLWGRDSLGNAYRPVRSATEKPEEPGLYCRKLTDETSRQTSLWISLGNFDPDAQWVEVYYDRDGRDLVLHIDLSGGVKK